ncbi:MAG: FkbM family methyltransferase [Rhabdochlamydiaceae bacterium]|nr:FkbM family methyltransferase [Rhabdochlamydiaceae bacterium]
MNPTIKQLLTPVLSAATFCVDRSALLQKLLRTLPVERKIAIVKRLTRLSSKQTVAECNGIRFDVNFKDMLQRLIYFNAFDMRSLNNVLSYVEPGMRCLDIGANVGFYSLHLAKKVGKTGFVHGIEADPVIYNSFLRNCGLNSFASTIRTHNVAISNCVGQLQFYTHDGNNWGAGSLTQFAHIQGKTIEVPAITLDHFMEEHSVEYFDFVKIDIEANEFELLEGAKNTLNEKRLHKIYIEFNGILLAQKSRSFKEFVALFADHGYHPIGHHLDLVEAIERGKIDPTQICTDFLFAPHQALSSS